MSIESDISFVARGIRRKQILMLLKNSKLTQPEIKKITGMYKEHTSRALKELSERKLIICLNPEDVEFKFYKITPLGKKVLEYLEKI
jgi:predicted transcriptional regulator